MRQAISLDALLDATGFAGNETHFVIEGTYLDSRESAILGLRRRQYLDAMSLVDQVHARLGKGRCTVVSLVNDFDGTICGIDSCVSKDSPTSSATKPTLREMVEAHSAKAARAADIELPVPGALFGMRHARRRALRHIERLLRKGDDRLVVEESEPDLSYIFAETPDGRVHIAAKGNDWRISARCTAILSWHYFELIKFAHMNVPKARSIVIVDFLTPHERDRTQAGAEVAFALYELPPEVNSAVCNCVYFPDEIALRVSTP
jgi:hypothetical protein